MVEQIPFEEIENLLDACEPLRTQSSEQVEEEDDEGQSQEYEVDAQVTHYILAFDSLLLKELVLCLWLLHLKSSLAILEDRIHERLQSYCLEKLIQDLVNYSWPVCEIPQEYKHLYHVEQVPKSFKRDHNEKGQDQIANHESWCRLQ